MSEFAIRVENLGKKYVLRHEREKHQYKTLRDAIETRVKSVVRFRRNVANPSNGACEEFWALKDVSFEVKKGEAVGIIGRNGAGKSTLLKLLSRITEPTKGRMELEGRVASLLEVGTGFHPELTGRENIFLNGAVLGMRHGEIKRKFDDIVGFAEIDRFLDTPVKRYSSGMYMRLAFAVAAHLEPDVLLVDEVLAVGDVAFQTKCLGKMDSVARQGRTVLFVSHQMGVMASLCERGVLFDRGEIVASGEIRRVIEEYLNRSNRSDNAYHADGGTNITENKFVSVATERTDGTPASEFAHSESICLSIKMALSAPSSQLLLGVGFENGLQSRVFGVVRETVTLRRNGADGIYLTRLRLPARLIAPNRYSFSVALFEHTGMEHDHLRYICPVHVFDDGTPLARFEGADLGSIVVDGQWD
jgi:lipopolysaccharide transport system ATP-binding protein